MTWPQIFFSFSGRIRRRTYWLGFAILLGAWILINAVVPIDFFNNLYLTIEEVRTRPYAMLKPSAYVEFAVVTWIAIALGVKRCHDRNHSGWYLLIYLIPIIGELWICIELGFFRGTSGPNRFGPDPLDALRSSEIAAAQ